MPGIGYQNPIGGSKSDIGVPINGYMPQPLRLTDTTTSAQNRFSLREAWNTTYRAVLLRTNQRRIITPFRANTNAGDLLCRQDYSCGGSCQTSQSKPGLYGLKSKFGSISNKCDGTGVPPGSCNGKYVYDGSDYITYLKQKAILATYNTTSNGGDMFHSGQSAYRAIRRY